MNQSYPGPECGYFEDVMSTNPCGRNVPLTRILTAIRSEKWKEPIEAIRRVSQEGLDAKAQDAKEKRLKRKLPGFMMSATSKTGRHTKDDCSEHSGVVQIDIDGLEPDSARELRSLVSADRHVLAAWISPRGCGLKLALRIETTILSHDEGWRRAAGHIEAEYSVTFDPSPKAVNALCFV